MAIELEHTDTFGGDANYCWCRRETLPPGEYSDRQLVRRAKAFAGFTGLRCATENFGDMIRITPRGICQTVFVTWSD
jgi:hypothetical protein